MPSPESRSITIIYLDTRDLESPVSSACDACGCEDQDADARWSRESSVCVLPIKSRIFDIRLRASLVDRRVSAIAVSFRGGIRHSRLYALFTLIALASTLSNTRSPCASARAPSSRHLGGTSLRSTPHSARRTPLLPHTIHTHQRRHTSLTPCTRRAHVEACSRRVLTPRPALTSSSSRRPRLHELADLACNGLALARDWMAIPIHLARE